jgi:hypothetical protein
MTHGRSIAIADPRTVGEMDALDHVLWIGGPPSSGKTSVATRLARAHGLRWYNADTRTWEHRDRALDAGSAAARRWEAMTVEERHAAAPAAMVELSLHATRGPMVVDDLRRFPASPLIVAEGSTLPASAVSAGIALRSRAIWLLPTDEFQRARFEERGLPAGTARFYRFLGDVIRQEARDHGAPTLEVDGSLGVDELFTAVEERFAEALAAGPRAESRAERRALLREANEASASQVRGYFARPWAVGDADVVVRTFLCECGDPSCHEEVRVAVAAVANPVLAPGHV